MFLLVWDHKTPSGLQPGSGPFLERADNGIDSLGQQIAVLVHLGAVFSLLVKQVAERLELQDVVD